MNIKGIINAASTTIFGTALFKPSVNATTAFQIQDKDAALVLDADTTNKRVGVGLASPLATLHVVAPAAGESLRLTDNTNTTLKVVHAATGTQFQGGDSTTFWEATVGGDLCFWPYVTGRKVGIGANAPGKLLELKDTSSTTGQLRLGDGSNYFDIGRDNASTGDFKIYKNATHLITILASGKLGIGTEGPSTNLHVVVTDTTTNNFASVAIFGHALSSGTAAANIGSVFQMKAANDAGTQINACDFGGKLTDVTAGAEKGACIIRTATANALTEKFRIDNAGNVGLSTVTPKSILHVLLSSLPAYANNAAAVTGGLTAGAFYRTNGDPDTVCVVH